MNREFFSAVRSAVTGEPFELPENVTNEQLNEMLVTADKHDSAHLLAYVFDKIKIKLPNLGNYIFAAVYRYEQINYALTKATELLEQAEISFMPLKGSVLRKYYPEPWMRTSCDIDVLLHKADAEKAMSCLINTLGYTYKGQTSHDISLFSPDGVHLELHYDLLEQGYSEKPAEILNSVWDSARVCDGYKYCYQMTDELFYFYHVAHMAKHFEEGGCGIRPFVDLWILDNLKKTDVKKRDDLLSRGELLTFASVVRKLSRVWFENGTHDGVTLQTESYILDGGLYGTTENRVSVQQQKKGGRSKFMLSRIFMPYEELKFNYPILQKHKWLTPIMEIRRWLNLLKPSALKRSVREAKINVGVSKNETEVTQTFLKDIGLK